MYKSLLNATLFFILILTLAMLSNFTSTVSQVATATADAISNFSDDLLFDSQSSGAEGRFRKYFPGFTSEKLFAG